jgi:hypothetical protein
VWRRVSSIFGALPPPAKRAAGKVGTGHRAKIGSLTSLTEIHKKWEAVILQLFLVNSGKLKIFKIYLTLSQK